METSVSVQRPMIRGAPVDVIDLDRALALVAGWLADERASTGDRERHGTPLHVVTVNPEVMIPARRDHEFASVLRAEVDEKRVKADATVLLVAFGHPTQDLWIAPHREMLAAHGILVSIGVGGTFDYLSGRVPRAPRLIRRLGLEWLYRLVR